MRHQNQNRKFGRERDQRRALMRSLASSLILEEKITTTEAKAKELRPYVEKMVTKGKDNNLATQRLLISKLSRKEAVKKIMDEIAPKYKERNGGYTRITKLGQRMGDASPMAIIEFV